MANQVYNGAALVQAAGPALGQLLGNDVVRIQIGAEFATLLNRIAAAPANDPRVQSITAWHCSFSRALRHPNPQQVITEYVQELVRLLRDPPGPDGVEPPFPAELFGDRPMPIIRYIVEKMRDRRSLFYSEQFDQEAVRVLAAVQPIVMEVRNVVQNGPAQDIPNDIDPNIPPELLEQLRQIEANIARRVQVEAQRMDGLRALQGRVHQREVVLQANIDRVAQQHLEDGQQIREEAERIRLLDLEQRAVMVGAANRLRQEAEDLRAEAARLQRHLDVNRERIGELERANIQLQIEINNTRSQIADKKSNWLLDVVCIVASVAISWALQMPVVIIPPK